jgi:HPt (histidine-containing phosphotransfer) domain-containing protein
MKGDAERCLEAGMDAYLTKPLQVEELHAVIRRVAGAAPPVRPAPLATAPPSGGVLEMTRLLERVGGNRRALAGLVRLFLADQPRLLRRIRRAIGQRDARGLRTSAHALKGAVSNFAAPAATAAAQRLQQIGESGDLDGARSACVHLEQELERVRRALSALLPQRRARPHRPARR